MEYKDFYERARAFEEFKILRNKLNNAIENPREDNFLTSFRRIKEQAGRGDVVAQDVVAYFYRDGVARFLREDYLKYMYWEILSAASGNKFAIEKLQFFLGYAYDTVVDNDDFGIIKYKCGIDEFNYIYIIGQRICEQLAADLNLTAESLAASEDQFRPYAPEYFRDLRHAIDAALPKVIESMKSGSEI